MSPPCTLSAAILFTVTCGFAEHAPVPRGDERIESVHLFELPGKHAEIEAAIAQPEGIYVAVDVRNEKWDADLQVWHIRNDGTLTWAAKLPQENSQT